MQGELLWFVVLCFGGLLFALLHVFRGSFVCSFVLMHVFRGSLWALCSFALLPMVSNPFASARGVGRLWALDTWSMLCLWPHLEGSSELCVLVVSSRCPCLWGPRFFWVECGLCVSSHAKWLCSLPLSGFRSLGWAFRPLPLKPYLCAHLMSTH